MYLDYLVDIPESKGKITFRKKGNTSYVYYEYSRTYDPEKQYTTVRRSTIGKLSADDPSKMRPNENFRKFFPDVEVPEEKADSSRSSCLRAGTYMAVSRTAKELGITDKLGEAFGAKNAGIIMDLAAYSIITEGNAAQYYPDYAYNHPFFTQEMKQYSDSRVSDFFRELNEEQRQNFLELWNKKSDKDERIYISYDSTNKNCEAGDISMVEFGAAKVDTGAPIFNYAVGFDTSNELPLLYEKYPGSINDVSQLQYMIAKVKSYGYRNIGFILDRGYFSKENLNFMDQNGFSFVIMVKGLKDLVRDLVLKNKGTFESEWGSQVPEFGVYGKTIHTFIYSSDTKKRYVHLYYNAGKAAGERYDFETKLLEMQKYLEQYRDTDREFGPAFHKYFHMHYNKENHHFVYAEPNLPAIRDALNLCGYFVIITSEKMDHKDAITLYKSRDSSEKLFRADKSYLGNSSLRVASDEAAANKIFIGFIALIIRCRMYTKLRDKARSMVKKPNYLTVPAAVRELEKIEICRQADHAYRLDHAITKTQKEILDAFGMNPADVKETARGIDKILKGEV